MASQYDRAVNYIDAFQSMRLSIFGEILPIEFLLPTKADKIRDKK